MFNGLNSVTFSKFPIEERKLNFFIDFYQYYNHFAGKMYNYELDTPHSICAKLVFQLENNHDSRGIKFVKNHLKRLAAFDPPYTTSFNEYQPLLDIWQRWTAAGGRNGFLREHYAEFLRLAKALSAQLATTIIEDTVEKIKQHLLNNEPLETQKNGIIFYTKILVSETIIGRKSRNEARELFAEIMTNDYRKFPYPSHITTPEEKRRFFSEKNIVVTLNAIKDFTGAPLVKQYLYFRIPGLELADNYVYEHNNAKVYPVTHPDIRGMLDWLSAKQDTDLKDFFKGKIMAIGEIRVTSATVKGAHKMAKKDMLNTVRYIEAVLEKSIVVDTESYIHTEDKITYGWNIRFRNGKAVIREYERLQLEDNAYDCFKDGTSRAGQEFILHEQFYLQAQIAQSMEGLWAYLEFILAEGSQPVITADIAAAALVLDEEEFQFWTHLHYLRNTIDNMNSNCIKLGMTFDQQQAMLGDLDKFKEFGTQVKSDLFQYGFQKMMTRLETSDPIWLDNRKAVYRFYRELLDETYEQRNLIQHQGISSEMAVTKLTSTLAFMFARIRYVLFDYAKRFPAKNRMELIEQIKHDTALWREVSA